MTGIEVLGVDNILLDVGDLEQARAFYEEVLGLPVKFIIPRAGIIAYRLGAEQPGLLLRARAMEIAPPRATPRLWLEVPDARAAATLLREAGAALLGEARAINTGWVVEVADPWGNVLGLTDYVNEPAKGRQR